MALKSDILGFALANKKVSK